MRKLFLLPVLALSAFTVQAQNSYIIEGEIKNAPEDEVIILFANEGDLLTKQAEDTIRNGKFRFSGKTTENSTECISLIAQKGRTTSMLLDLWVRPGSHVKITADDMLVYTWNVESDVPEQQTRQNVIAPVRRHWDELQRINEKRGQLVVRMRAKDITEEEKAKLKHELDSMKTIECRQIDEIVEGEIKTLSALDINEAWIEELLDCVYFTEMTKNEQNKNRIKVLYDNMPDEWKNTNKGAEIASIIYPPRQPKPGEPAVDGDLYDLSGNIHHLADFKGKYILLDFWNYGCGPCIKAIPEMKEIADAYKDSLEVVSLSLDNDKIWRRASAEHGITWNNFNDKRMRSGIAASYDIHGIPLFVLISPDGKLIEKWSGYSEGCLKDRIGKLFSRQ